MTKGYDVEAKVKQMTPRQRCDFIEEVLRVMFETAEAGFDRDKELGADQWAAMCESVEDYRLMPPRLRK